MARARNIKPGFFQNDELGELQPIARLLFIGLWTIADFNGCLEYRPKRIKAQILPYDDCNLDLLMNNLDKSGFISIYSIQGQQYVKIMNFEKHQNPHKNEREAGTDIPNIDKKDNEFNGLQDIEINLDKNGTTPADSLLLIPDSLIQEKSKVASKKQNFVLPDWIPVDAWQGYLEMRKKKNKIPTDRARDLVIKELLKLHTAGHNLEYVLDASTKNGWTDVYEQKKIWKNTESEQQEPLHKGLEKIIDPEAWRQLPQFRGTK